MGADVRVAGRVTIRVDGVVVASGDNLVVTSGLTTLASALVGTAISASGWYLELGTGTTAVEAGNVALATPNTASWRLATVATATTATAAIEAVYPASAGNGTWTELGLFSGATSTAGSGTLFARLLVPWTKTSSQVATVAWSVTLTTS